MRSTEYQWGAVCVPSEEERSHEATDPLPRVAEGYERDRAEVDEIGRKYRDQKEQKKTEMSKTR